MRRRCSVCGNTGLSRGERRRKLAICRTMKGVSDPSLSLRYEARESHEWVLKGQCTRRMLVPLGEPCHSFAKKIRVEVQSMVLGVNLSLSVSEYCQLALSRRKLIRGSHFKEGIISMLQLCLARNIDVHRLEVDVSIVHLRESRSFLNDQTLRLHSPHLHHLCCLFSYHMA